MFALVVAATLATGPSAPASDSPRIVSVRLHDYAGLSDADLLAAQDEVSTIYAGAGVQMVWREIVRPDRARQGLAAWPDDPPADLSVLIVRSARARGAGVRPDVAGYAPAGPGPPARLAFIVADRTAHAAILANVLHSRVLARVIAHELAHVLMPGRPHSREGILRAQWNPAEFRRAIQRAFSEAEIIDIRRAVANVPVAERVPSN